MTPNTIYPLDLSSPACCSHVTIINWSVFSQVRQLFYVTDGPRDGTSGIYGTDWHLCSAFSQSVPYLKITWPTSCQSPARSPSTGPGAWCQPRQLKSAIFIKMVRALSPQGCFTNKIITLNKRWFCLLILLRSLDRALVTLHYLAQPRHDVFFGGALRGYSFTGNMGFSEYRHYHIGPYMGGPDLKIRGFAVHPRAPLNKSRSTSEFNQNCLRLLL